MKTIAAGVLLAGAIAWTGAMPQLMGQVMAQDAAGQEPSLFEVLGEAAAMPPAEQQSRLLRFVQDRLSTPDRQIRISNIDGLLSSAATIDLITISDTQGVWLAIENASINWNQAALLLGRLDVRSLSAEQIRYVRNPVETDPAPPSPEAGGFAIPEFPVAIILEQLSVPSVVFGEDVFGLGSEIALSGSMRLDGGSLDADLDITRLDGPGGQLLLDVAYDADTQVFDLDFNLTEPEDGIIANLLNIEGRPEVTLALQGSGPITDLETTLTLDAAQTRILEGQAVLGQTAEGLSISTQLGGPLSQLLPEIYRDFFGAETALSAQALLREGGGITLDRLQLSGGQLSLDASARTTDDGFLSQLQLLAEIAAPDGTPVLLPIPGGDTRIDRGRFTIDYGTDGSEEWSGNAAILGLDTAEFDAEALEFTAGGVAANIEDPATRRVTFNGDGTVRGIAPASEEIAQALGTSIGVGIAALWSAGEPIELPQLRIMGEALALDLSGAIDEGVFTGDIALETASLAPFSGLAERDLDGALVLAASGEVNLLTGGFDLTLDGTAENLSIDEPTADTLLAGTARLTGRVARTPEGLIADGFEISNPQITFSADGRFATGTADFAFEASLADLSMISPEASGAVTARGTARGEEGDIALTLEALVPQGRLVDRQLRDARIGFDGNLLAQTVTGTISGAAFLDGFRVALSGELDVADEAVRLSALRFEAPGATITGDLLRRADGLLEGDLALAGSNIETAAALALLDASGQANAQIALTVADGEQNAELSASVANLRVNDITIGAAELEASIADLFGVPAIDGSLAGRGIVAGGTRVETLSATANVVGERTEFSGSAQLANATQAALAGALEPVTGGYRLSLTRADLTQGQLSARLAQPTALMVAGDTVDFEGVVFDVGSGRVTATGTAGQQLDINLTIASLPLSIANTVAPDLGLAGTLDGTATVTGPAADPRASFSVQASGVNAAAIADLGIAPLALNAQGTYADGRVTLSSAQATGAQGLTFNASGTVPLDGAGLNLSASGTIPLTLANRFVIDRGGQASGTVTVNAQIAGSLDNPQISGTVSTAGAEYIDPELNLRLQAITGSARLTGDAVVIDSLTAQLATGGSISVSGSVGITPDFDANLAIALNDARYADGTLVVATLSGNVTVTGPLLGAPLIGGGILVQRAEIAVPEGFGGSATLIDVTHRNPPPPVAQTLARARIDQRAAPTPIARPNVARLDLTINAPNQVFIRGRGLDAEVGGQVRLIGNINDIQPIGQFDLIRGRLSILGQRIDFQSGSVTLIGDLDPQIELVATTQGEGITVFVTVSGRASALDVAFSSQPMLPEDEVLSRLIFNRGVGDLSPLQLAQLAAAAAELAGGGGGGLFESLRQATGLDDLDIVTDSEGNAAVRAGRYIQDNVYLGVEAGAGGQSRVTVDLDITDDIRARAAAGTDGSSSLGVYFERDY